MPVIRYIPVFPNAGLKIIRAGSVSMTFVGEFVGEEQRQREAENAARREQEARAAEEAAAKRRHEEQEARKIEALNETYGRRVSKLELD